MSPVASSAASPIATPSGLEATVLAPARAPATTGAATASPIPTESSQVNSTSADWAVILTLLTVVLSLVLLWSGIKKLEVSNPIKAILSLLDLALLIAAIVGLGWAGVFLAVGVNILALLAHSISIAARYDDILTDAAVQNGSDRKEMKSLAKRLQSRGGSFKAFGPIKTAYLIKYLSQRGRSASEIEVMAPHVADLWVIFRPDLESLVEKFDRLLRLSGASAIEAQRVADVLTTATQRSSATFDEMIDGMLAFYDP